MANPEKVTNGSRAVPVNIRISYEGIDDLPIHFSNAFTVQKTPLADEYIISFGHVAPPLLLGTPEEVKEQAKEIHVIQAKMLARYAMNGQRLEELLSVFGGYLQSAKEGKLK